MQTQQRSENGGRRSRNISTDRPDSAQLVDLHIYLMPKQIWKNQQNLAENDAINQAVSIGFVHVQQEMSIRELRREIIDLCGQENKTLKDFTYLRSVGRCLTKVKKQQEADLRVKHYRPPTTSYPEIFLLEGNEEETENPQNETNSLLLRESPIQREKFHSEKSFRTGEKFAMKSDSEQSTTTITSSFRENHEYPRNEKLRTADSTSTISRASSTLSTRGLAKLQEEQERLRLRQLELERQRREIELEENRQNSLKEQRKKEDEAATRIQANYRGYRTRKTLNERKKVEEPEIISSRSSPIEEDLPVDIERVATAEIDRLQREAERLTRRKAHEEQIEQIEAREIGKLSILLDDLKRKRSEMESTREAIGRQMQNLHGQITVRRKEERDIWKQKYLFEKKKTLALEERAQNSAIDRTDVKTQLEQIKLELKNSLKLRQQAENECFLLRREIQQLRSALNQIGPNSLQTQNHQNPMQKSNLPISLDITLQY